MKLRPKLAKVSFLAVGILTHVSRGVGAMLPNSIVPPPLAPLPPLNPVSDTLFDKSRLRIAESAEPPLAQVWASGMRGALPVTSGQSSDEVLTRVALADPLPGADQPTLHVKEPPSPTPSFQQVSRAQTSAALNSIPSLTDVQRKSIADYVAPSKNLVEEMKFNGKELLILRDPQTHEYRGEVTISARPDGAVQVTKLTGATLDLSKSVEVPILSGPKEEVPKELEAEVKKDVELTVPAVKVEGKAELGPVSESTLVLNPDGTGYETGRRTNLASASAGAQVSAGGSAEEGFAGVKGGVGAQALKVEGFANYLGKPTQDENGNLVRDVYGVTGDAHTTLGEIGGQLGCSDKDGCGGKFTMGLLGIGFGGSLSHGKVKVGEEAEGIPEKGLASTPEQVEQADAPEIASDPPSVQADEAADKQAAQPGEAGPSAEPADQTGKSEASQSGAEANPDGSDGSADDLHNFVNQYPNKTGDTDQPSNDNHAGPAEQGGDQAAPQEKDGDQAAPSEQGGDQAAPQEQDGDNQGGGDKPSGPSNDQGAAPGEQPTPGQENGPY